MTIEAEARAEVAELIARVIRGSRYSGRYPDERKPSEWHNPVDLRNGQRIAEALEVAGYLAASRREPSESTVGASDGTSKSNERHDENGGDRCLT